LIAHKLNQCDLSRVARLTSTNKAVGFITEAKKR